MSTPFVFQFAAPAKPLTMNQRLHHMRRAELTAAWRQAAWTAARAATGPTIPRFDRARIEIAFSFPNVRRRDIANWHPTAKAIVDALVEGRGTHRGLGVLPDDDDAHLDGPHLSSDGLTNGPVPVVTVLVTPIEGDI